MWYREQFGGIGEGEGDIKGLICPTDKNTSNFCRRLNDTNRVTVNTRDADGQTGLHHAAKYGRHDSNCASSTGLLESLHCIHVSL